MNIPKAKTLNSLKEDRLIGINIVSDGYPNGTKVLTDTGHELEWVSEITWQVKVGHLAEATIKFSRCSVDIESFNNTFALKEGLERVSFGKNTITPEEQRLQNINRKVNMP